MMQKNNSKPKREPLSRLWFMSRGYSKADPQYTNGYAIWLHPQTNDVLNQYGQKIKLNLLPKEKFKKNATRYLQIPREFGNRYLARLKYITFKGNIPDGHTIDHIDGNPLNNDIRNLRAVTRAINYRDVASCANYVTKEFRLICSPVLSLKVTNAWPNGKPRTQNTNTNV